MSAFRKRARQRNLFEPKKKAEVYEPVPCFYCGALVSESFGVGDHFPIPEEKGGSITVPCCRSCHDMKDRFPLDRWPMEWVSAVVMDFPKMSRETRIFLAKSISLFARRPIPKNSTLIHQILTAFGAKEV